VVPAAEYQWNPDTTPFFGNTNWSTVYHWLNLPDTTNWNVKTAEGRTITATTPPGNGDSITFTARAGNGNVDCIVDTNVWLKKLTIAADYTSTITIAGGITVKEKMEMSNGTIAAAVQGGTLNRAFLGIQNGSSLIWKGGTLQDITVTVDPGCTLRGRLGIGLPAPPGGSLSSRHECTDAVPE
jgi:hypothetical protein